MVACSKWSGGTSRSSPNAFLLEVVARNSPPRVWPSWQAQPVKMASQRSQSCVKVLPVAQFLRLGEMLATPRVERNIQGAYGLGGGRAVRVRNIDLNALELSTLLVFRTAQMGAVPASVVLRDRDVVDEIAPPLRVVHRQHREAPESLPSMNRRSCCRGVSDNRHLLWPLQSSN